MTAAKVLFGLYLVTLMFSLGLGLTPETGGKKAARLEHIGLFIRALLLTLIVVPLVALGVTVVLKPPAGVTVALLVLVAAPGGRSAPQLARMAGADLSMSTELTLLLVKLSALTAPPTARFLLGVHHLALADIPIMLSLLVLQVLPLYLGKAVRRWRGAFAERVEKGIQAFINTLAVGLFIAILIISGVSGFASLWGRGLLAVVTLAGLSGALAWLLCGPIPRTRRAMMITANAHNLALALIITSTSFPELQFRSTILAVWILFMSINFLFALVTRQRAARPTPGDAPRLVHAIHT